MRGLALNLAFAILDILMAMIFLIHQSLTVLMSMNVVLHSLFVQEIAVAKIFREAILAQILYQVIITHKEYINILSVLALFYHLVGPKRLSSFKKIQSAQKSLFS